MTISWTRPTRSLIAASLAGLLTFPALGQPAAVPGGAAGTAPAVADAPSEVATPGFAPASASDKLRNATIPEVNFKETPLEDVVSFLQDVSKDYRAVVVRRTAKDAGPLITMRVKGASIQQLLGIITTAYQGITIVPVEGPNGPVDVITIHPPLAVPGPGGGGFFPMMGAMEGQAAEPQQVVRVYRLIGTVSMTVNLDEVNDREQGIKAEKAALANILSLIKATMETVGGTEAPKLQLHEETKTLIFSGSVTQQQALEDVLLALETDEAVRPSSAKVWATENDVRRLQAELKSAQAAVEKARQETVLTRTELTGIQRQADAQVQELAAKNRIYRDQIEMLQSQIKELSKQKSDRTDEGK